MGIHRQPFPTHNATQIIEDPAQFDPNRPAPFVLILFANLFVTSAFADWENQLDGKAIADREKRRLRQEAVAPGLMIAQQALQAGSIGPPPNKSL
jgi:hypothetical protein